MEKVFEIKSKLMKMREMTEKSNKRLMQLNKFELYFINDLILKGKKANIAAKNAIEFIDEKRF